MRNLLTVLTLCLVSFIAIAKPHQVEVKLIDIELIKASERDGDELYFSISEYPSTGEPRIFRVPIFPLNWKSRNLKNINNVTLWKGIVADDTSVVLVFSLLEQDIAFVNVDDHIGSAQLKVVNNKGVISKTWGQPKFKDQPKVEQKNTEYLMFGNDSEYRVKFNVLTREQ